MYYRAGCAALSVRSLAIPVLAVRGKPVQLGNPSAAHFLLRFGTGPRLPWLASARDRGQTDKARITGSLKTDRQ